MRRSRTFTGGGSPAPSGGGAADGGGKPYFFRAIASSFASPYLAASASTSASLLGLCSS